MAKAADEPAGIGIVWGPVDAGGEWDGEVRLRGAHLLQFGLEAGVGDEDPVGSGWTADELDRAVWPGSCVNSKIAKQCIGNWLSSGVGDRKVD
jgi:hypothetical protein